VTSRDDAQALAVGRAVLDLLGALGIGLRALTTIYSQYDLPQGARSKEAYLERHRDRVRAGVAGWTRSGKVRGVTQEAWELDVAEQTSRSRRQRATTARPRLELVDSDPEGREIDRAYGVRLKRGGR
jgi:hypothetical protein